MAYHKVTAQSNPARAIREGRFQREVTMRPLVQNHRSLQPDTTKILLLVRVAALFLGTTSLGDGRAIRLLLPGVALSVLGLLLHDRLVFRAPREGRTWNAGKGNDYAVFRTTMQAKSHEFRSVKVPDALFFQPQRPGNIDPHE